MSESSSIAHVWGSTPEERASSFPCDHHLRDADEAYFRALDVEAPAPVVFRWFCQLRAAPYSYDWIDNFGRRSPRSFTPGLEKLEVGQRVMTFFELVEFEPDRHLTILAKSSGVDLIFGAVAATYAVFRRGDAGSRVVVKMLVRHPRGPVGWGMRWILPWGDLVMMRRQLLNLKDLAEAVPFSR